MTSLDSVEVQNIPISDIHVLNPRTRSRRIHTELVDNIRRVGLKRPVTVSRREGAHRQPYDLVCGQGRIEALQVLGHTTVPAVVVDAAEEDCLVMSLVENVARRVYPGIEFMREIGRLRQRGHTENEIADIIGVTPQWINMVTNLLERGEEKLLAAVEGDVIPLSMATDIARSSTAEIQKLLSDAYQQGFRGKKLSRLRHLLEARAKRRPRVETREGLPPRERQAMSAADIRRIFEKEAERQRLVIKKATFVHERLVFSTQAIKELLDNTEFMALLQAEKLDTLPKLLQERIRSAHP
ncbi:plasmid partitioning protein RepB C-terminal domain-containing protein [Luteibacter sp. NPDC031894]|uniref:plasmid partitioning protein RepB C-terminal domain-containing protein n=1 Tax=Luteibacter sp. NPDC031894 TaxID=3390572 RepID=UPI003D07E56C